MNRWAEYYRAQQRVMLAEVEAYRVCPHYDGDEAKRAERVADYEKMARDYERMAREAEA